MQLRRLDEELQQIACEELNECPKRLEADLAAIKSWLAEQRHLNARTDDQWLIAFLRGCKYNMEKTKSKLEKFYTMRTKMPKMFKCTNVDEPELREILREGTIFLLPTPLNENGPRILLIRFAASAPGKYCVETFFRLCIVVQQLALLHDDHITVQGYQVIMDMRGSSMAHFIQWTPRFVSRCIAFGLGALPCRQKAIHFINAPAAVVTLLNFFKPMFPKKQQERFYIHSSKLEQFCKHIPTKYLPQEYGGENGSLAELIAAMHKQFDEHREYFSEEANYGTDESLRQYKKTSWFGRNIFF